MADIIVGNEMIEYKEQYGWISNISYYNNKEQQSTMQEENTKQSSHLTARVMDFIDIHPSHIQHISFSPTSNLLYVARKLYSEVYTVNFAPSAKNTTIQQIMVLEPCQQIFEIDGMIVMVFPFEIKISQSGRWVVHPFTTQLLPNSTKFDSKNNKLYTFHVSQNRQWTISEDDGIHIKYLAKHETPYHVSEDGALEGFGKKLKPSNSKENRFTVLQESQCGKYLFIGTNKGELHVYQTKFLTHIKTFHRHQGAILSIHTEANICYFTGSDSKISSLIYLHSEENQSGNWMLSKQVRAQSHDILSLTLIKSANSSFLVSGGITTDICLYKLNQSSTLTDQWNHKISYSYIKQVQMVGPYVVVNKYSSFEIWKINEYRADEIEQEYLNNRENVDLMVKYDIAFYKSVREILVKKSDNEEHTNAIMLFVRTQEEANLWSFDEQQGLVKLLTVKNQYNLACWFKRDSILTIREGSKLELFNYHNGNIKEIADVEVTHPTDLRVCSKGNRIVVGSRYSQQVEAYQIGKQENGKKSIKKVIKIRLEHSYNILDLCYYNPVNLMVKYQHEKTIEEIDKKGNQISTIVTLPTEKIRSYGWVEYACSSKIKKFWYAVSQGKILIVTRMASKSQVKKIRVKQMPRIADVIVNDTEVNQRWNLGVIPFNFSKMIGEQIMPIVGKKIM